MWGGPRYSQSMSEQVLDIRRSAKESSHDGFTSLGAFEDQLRADGSALAAANVERLYAEARLCVQETSLPQAAIPVASKSALAKGLRFLRLVPAFFAQKRRMDRDLSPEGLAILAVGIASGRLLSGQSPASIRSYLARISRAFPVSAPDVDRFSRQIDSERPIFLCEPIAESPFWENRDALWREKIYLVDGFYLFFLVLISPLRSASAILRRVWEGRKQGRVGKLPFFFALFERGLQSAFAYRRSVDALFYTCNSFLTEVLRWTLMEMPSCQSIHELLHGIPTSNVEAYFASLLRNGPEARRKHFFVPQIPESVDFGIFDSQAIVDGKLAINAYLRSQFVEQGFLASEYCKLTQHRFYSPGVAVIAFVGGHGDPETLSKMFAIECRMIEQVQATLNALGRAHVIVYCPHPSFDLRRAQANPFFDDHRVILGPRTISTFFMADAALTLYSSAVFEAAYFGVAAFLPVKRSEGFFAPQVLAKADHQPESDGCFLDSLTRFLEKSTASPTKDLAARLNARVAILGEAGV